MYIFKSLELKSFIIVVCISTVFCLFTGCGSHKESTNGQTFISDKFEQSILLDNLADPTKISIAADGNIFLSLKGGQIYQYNPETKRKKLMGAIPTKNVGESGLLGIALDPSFTQNNFIYAFYTSPDGDYQRISRFTVLNEQLILASEINLITYKVFQERHQGGGIVFGKDRLLYISTGENSHPNEASGYAPIDERPEHQINDSQRSSANTKSLSGKILRIWVNEDGSYAIPEGNLFAKNDTLARPEVYVMGCRNPFKLFPDPTTGLLYWGEVGPDAGEPSQKGPQGHDELNIADKAGNYGWPYFIADNKPYAKYNYATNLVDYIFDTANVVNNSPNNTGYKKLPKPQKATFFYTYDEAKTYPQLGSGGRCIMAGPVYHYRHSLLGAYKFPEYFDNKLFLYDWMRCKVWALTLNQKYSVIGVENLFPNFNFRKPVDMIFGTDGCMYLLEYGSNWNNNADGRLTKIYYNRQNKAPVVKWQTGMLAGKLPLTVKITTKGTYDIENQEIDYEWFVDDKIVGKDSVLNYTFDKAGEYQLKLKVSDENGATSELITMIKAGNTLPKIVIDLTPNTAYFKAGENIKYKVTVLDDEDGNVGNQAKVSYRFLPIKNMQVADIESLKHPGLSLIEKSDCQSCHKANQPSVGPSYSQIKDKYTNTDDNLTALAAKIKAGGSGVWGSTMMSAHPTLDIPKLKDMVRYILADTNEFSIKKSNSEQQITIPTNAETIKNNALIIQATYCDQAQNGVGSNCVSATKIIRSPYFYGVDYDHSAAVMNSDEHINILFHTSYVAFNDLNMSNVQSVALDYTYWTFVPNNYVEILLDSPNGKSLGKKLIPQLPVGQKYGKMIFDFPETKGNHTLYIHYRPNLQVHEHFILKGFRLQ